MILHTIICLCFGWIRVGIDQIGFITKTKKSDPDPTLKKKTGSGSSRNRDPSHLKQDPDPPKKLVPDLA